VPHADCDCLSEIVLGVVGLMGLDGKKSTDVPLTDASIRSSIALLNRRAL
jgi:hypothetical protein